MTKYQIDFEAAAEYLLTDCRLSRGFEAQLVGLKVESATSTAIVIYVLSKLGKLVPEVAFDLAEELLSFSIFTEERFRQFGTYHPNSWSTAQSLLALNSVKVSEMVINETVEGLLKFQEENGGWTFSGKEDRSPFYAIYPVAALLSSPTIKESSKIAKSLRNTALYINTYIPQSQTESLTLEYLRRRLNPYSTYVSVSGEFPVSWIDLVENEFNKFTINEFSSSPFSMTFYGPSLYLLSRQFLPPDHPFSLYCIKTIIDSKMENKVSWPLAKKHKSGRVCSFSTALALLTLHYWEFDIDKHCLSVDIVNPYSLEESFAMLKNISSTKKIFVSYSSVDLKKAKKIVDSLKSIGCEVMFAEYDLLVGDSIPSFINDSLLEMEYFIICLSPSAITSKYVRDEIDGAKASEWACEKKTILPALLEECELPPILAAKKYANFTKNFKSGLSQLIRSI